MFFVELRPERCQTCRFAEKVTEQFEVRGFVGNSPQFAPPREVIQCRCMPPAPQGSERAWPVMWPNDWCGQWEPTAEAVQAVRDTERTLTEHLLDLRIESMRVDAAYLRGEATSADVGRAAVAMYSAAYKKTVPGVEQ